MLGTNPAALMRAIGQLALMVTAAVGLWSIVALVIVCVPEPDAVCASPSPKWILLHLTRSLIVVAALVAFRATTRRDRARVAVAGAVAIVVLELVMPIFWITVAPEGQLPRALLVGWALDEAWVLVGMGLLLASYSRRTPAPAETVAVLEQARRGSWWLGTLALLFVVVWLCALVSPVSPNTAVMLIAATLYGLLHQVRPVPGAVSPTTVALTFIPLGLPHQAHVVAAYGDFGLIEPKLMLAIAAASWVALASWQLYRTQRPAPPAFTAGSV